MIPVYVGADQSLVAGFLEMTGLTNSDLCGVPGVLGRCRRSRVVAIWPRQTGRILEEIRILLDVGFDLPIDLVRLDINGTYRMLLGDQVRRE